MRISYRILGILAGLFLATQAIAQTDSDPIQTAYDLCLDIPDDIEHARGILSDAGWEPDENAQASALALSVMVAQFDTTDLKETLHNASFMAASILGNSALGRDQIGVTFGPHKLALLGLKEGVPYCVLSGSEGLLSAFLTNHRPTHGMTQKSSILTQYQGLYEGTFRIRMGRFDLDKLNALIHQSSLSDNEKNVFQHIIAPEIIRIANSEISQ